MNTSYTFTVQRIGDKCTQILVRTPDGNS